MMVGLEMALGRAPQAHREETGADDDVETVEAGRHEEGRGIDPVGEVERGVSVFVSLDRGEAEAEDHRHGETLDQPFLIAFEQRMMRPGHRRSR